MSEKRKYGKKRCKFCEMKIDHIDYKDLDVLKYGISERFKIMPRRLTGTCKKHQEALSNAVKRARAAALLPYIVDRKHVVENPFDKIKPLHS
ncbi:MAG: 30S ribosomal protein S18 [Epsilonproteobacteria bacterium]|nr:30S ribosomal protein S18 [Campylobacterota bacterium]